MSKEQDMDRPEVIEPEPQGKGRPTPSRREAEAARRRPLVPKDRKAAKRAARAKRDAEFQREQIAMKTGDEAHLPYIHRGPVRRWARDYIDARTNLASYFFFLAFAVLLLVFIQAQFPDAALIVMLALYGLMIVMLVDSLIAVRSMKKKMDAKFGPERVPGGIRWQMFGRTFYPRRWRRPVPMVARGEWPAGAK
ncbi:DUF3043 domain-containing protein [Flaviflexus equikiangi]|uniref:DUF3043 domain-containing protein n=1 Tax=Flaviflexus equikiangi TaxID=2758573 RepID=A0ABS2TFV7_9ACTO|nr:DUF3043 domain-containing protein [Flaviflexus equikiangi]MBM9433248.1 DUF3043 domain-containing protein [Flaviflexus equikiangi]